MTQREKALAELQVKLNLLARDAMDAMHHRSELDEESLLHAGHRHHADAVFCAFEYYYKTMEALIKAYNKAHKE